MNWYKKTIKLASIRYLYHGTSLNNLNSILSEGLNNNHGAVYDETFQNTKGERSVESYGGVYLTDSLRTALMAGFTASEKNKVETDTSVVAIAQIEDRTPSVLLDEDLLASPHFALIDAGASPEFPRRLAEWITGGFQNIEQGVDSYLKKLSTGRSQISDTRFLQGIRPYVYNLLKTYAIQKLALALNHEDWGTRELKNYYDLNNLPDMNTAIQNYRDANSLFMQKAHRLTTSMDDMYENNMRITNPISYRGRNKIILVSTFTRLSNDMREREEQYSGYSYVVKIIYMSNSEVLNQYIDDIKTKYSDNILVIYKNDILYENKRKRVAKDMNWYKKASLYILGKNDHKWMGKSPNIGWEAIRLKNGEILYDPNCNHWSLFSTYKNYIGDISNIESIGLLGGYGDYTIKRKGEEVKEYFFPHKL